LGPDYVGVPYELEGLDLVCGVLRVMDELDKLVLCPSEEELVTFSDLSFGRDQLVNEIVKEGDFVA
jgi:hypothetical protein